MIWILTKQILLLLHGLLLLGEIVEFALQAVALFDRLFEFGLHVVDLMHKHEKKSMLAIICFVFTVLTSLHV